MPQIPAHDGFLARRIKGPGLASTLFLQISSKEVLVAVRAHLEGEELGIWANRMRKIIQMPLDALNNLTIQKAFNLYGINWSTSFHQFDVIRRSSERFTKQLDRILQEKRKAYAHLP